MILKNFLKENLDNLVWGIVGAAGIAAMYFITKDVKTVTALGGAFVGICLNKMRGQNGK